MNNVVVRKAQQKDISAIQELLIEIGNYHSSIFPDVFNPGISRDDKEIEDLLQKEDVLFLVAEVENELAGLCHSEIRSSPDHPVLVKRTFGYIDTLIVKDTYRNRGIGRRLMENSHAWFEAREVKTVELNVWEFNDHAVELYQKLGYRAIKRGMRMDI